MNQQPANAKSFRKNRNQQQQPLPKQGAPKPPGQGTSRSARRRRNARERTAGPSAYVPNPMRQARSQPWNSGYVPRAPIQTRDVYLRNNSKHQHFVVPQNSAADYAHYVAAVMDPAEAPEGARVVSDAFAQPTAANKWVFAWEGANCNTSGNCQLIFDPRAAWGNNMLTIFNGNDWSYSTGAQAAAAGTAVKKSDKAASSLIGSWRIVAASMQVSSVGAADVKAGYYDVAFMPTELVSTVQGYGQDDVINEYFYARQSPNQTAEAIWIPRMDIDDDFVGIGSFPSNHSNVVITAVGFASLAKLSVQCCIHVEFIKSPTNFLSPVAVSAANTEAKPLLQNVLNTVPKYVTSPANSNVSVADRITSGLKDYAVSSSKKVATDFVTNLLTEYLGSSAKGGFAEGLLGEGLALFA